MKKCSILVIIVCLVWAAGCTENGSLTKPLERDLRALVNVRHFGAVGDGVSDDSSAFQAALDRGGSVYIPAGVYRLERTVLVDLDKSGPASIVGNGTAKIVMAGAGAAFKIVGTHGGTASPDSVKPNVWQKQRMPVIDGIEIVGEHAEACGLEITGTMKTTISRVLIRKTLNGIRLTGTNRNLVISDCHIYENRGIGIFYDNVNLHQSNICNSHISYNPGGGIIVRGGAVYNLQIGNCDIEFNMDEESPSTANVLLDISGGGSIAEIAVTGCTIQHTKNGIESANIRTVGRENRTIEFVAIANNILSDIDYNLHLKYTRGMGCMVRNTADAPAGHISLKLKSGSGNLIANNLVDTAMAIAEEAAEVQNNVRISRGGSKK